MKYKGTTYFYIFFFQTCERKMKEKEALMCKRKRDKYDTINVNMYKAYTKINMNYITLVIFHFKRLSGH